MSTWADWKILTVVWTIVHPWTTGAWTAWVHLFVDFFFFLYTYSTVNVRFLKIIFLTTLSVANFIINTYYDTYTKCVLTKFYIINKSSGQPKAHIVSFLETQMIFNSGSVGRRFRYLSLPLHCSAVNCICFHFCVRGHRVMFWKLYVCVLLKSIRNLQVREVH